MYFLCDMVKFQIILDFVSGYILNELLPIKIFYCDIEHAVD